uniref:RING-type domain-containing protein n=1 Tax=Steinernema glaseri TaxID=37863 RepID=A0A1I7YXC9_9BILA
MSEWSTRQRKNPEQNGISGASQVQFFHSILRDETILCGLLYLTCWCRVNPEGLTYSTMQGTELKVGLPQTQFAVKDGVIYYVEPKNYEKTLVYGNVDSSSYPRSVKFKTNYDFGTSFNPSGYDSLTIVNDKLVYVPEREADDSLLELEVERHRVSVSHKMISYPGEFISPTVLYCTRTRTVTSLEKQKRYKDSTSLEIGAHIIGFTYDNRFHFFRAVKDTPYIWSFDLDDEGNAYKQKIHDSDDAQYLMMYPGRTFSLRFGEVVIIVLYRTRQFFKYDIKRRTVVEITDLFEFKSHTPVSFRYVTQDKKNIYVCGDFNKNGLYCVTKLWRIPVPEREEIVLPRQGEPSSPSCNSDCNKCPICFEPFVIPKIFINCGHTVCNQCASKILGGGSSYSIVPRPKCPICRENVLLLGGQELPTNYALMDFINSQPCSATASEERSGLSCDQCKEKVSKKNFFFCAKCSNDANEHKICGSCAMRQHKSHSNMVKEIEFADAWDKMIALHRSKAIVEENSLEEQKKQFEDSIIRDMKSETSRIFEHLKGLHREIKAEHNDIKDNRELTLTSLEQKHDTMKKKVDEYYRLKQHFYDWKSMLIEQISSLRVPSEDSEDFE